MHGNTVLEISWTIIPALILAVMAVPTVATIFNLAKKPDGPDVVHVTVDGAPVVVAVHVHRQRQRVRHRQRDAHPGQPAASLDVDGSPTLTTCIHSFWVPELAARRTSCPAARNILTLEADRPGTFLGQCAEYCGLSHANMRMRVIAQTEADYEAWVASQQAPLSTRQGRASSTTLAKPSGAARRCHIVHEPEKPSARRRAEPHAPRRPHGVRRRHLPDATTRTSAKWIYDAPGRKPMGNARRAAMPTFNAARA